MKFHYLAQLLVDLDCLLLMLRMLGLKEVAVQVQTQNKCEDHNWVSWLFMTSVHSVLPAVLALQTLLTLFFCKPGSSQIRSRVRIFLAEQKGLFFAPPPHTWSWILLVIGFLPLAQEPLIIFVIIKIERATFWTQQFLTFWTCVQNFRIWFCLFIQVLEYLLSHVRIYTILWKPDPVFANPEIQ